MKIGDLLVSLMGLSCFVTGPDWTGLWDGEGITTSE